LCLKFFYPCFYPCVERCFDGSSKNVP